MATDEAKAAAETAATPAAATGTGTGATTGAPRNTNPRVFFDITMGGVPKGRILMEVSHSSPRQLTSSPSSYRPFVFWERKEEY
jgi:hypothetical protein